MGWPEEVFEDDRHEQQEPWSMRFGKCEECGEWGDLDELFRCTFCKLFQEGGQK